MPTRIFVTIAFVIAMCLTVMTSVFAGARDASSVTFPVLRESLRAVEDVFGGYRRDSMDFRDVLKIVVLIAGILVCSTGASICRRWHERRILRHPGARRSSLLPARSTYWIPPVIAVAAIMLLLAVPAPVLRHSSVPGDMDFNRELIERYTKSSRYIWLAMLGTAAFAGVLAGHVHRIANHNRRMKYVLAFSSTLLLWLASTVVSPELDS
jgi:hypothetical protein